MLKKVTMPDIQAALTQSYLRVSQILYFSIILGATFFLAVIVFIFLQVPGNATADEQAVDFINRLSLVHGALFAAALFLSGFLYRRLLGEERIEAMMGRMNPDDKGNYAYCCLAVIRTAQIIRTAILEMAVFFGLVVCFMAVTNKVMYQYPYYWANAGSYAVFIIILIKDFPSREKIMELFKNKMKYLLQY